MRVGNTDAEGRMAMADSLHYMKLKVMNSLKPHYYVTCIQFSHHFPNIPHSASWKNFETLRHFVLDCFLYSRDLVFGGLVML